MHRNWFVSKTNPEFLQYLASEASISRLLAQILVNRGIREVASIKSFLSPSFDALHDPFLLPDMGVAVNRLKTAIESKQTVFIHGDYDADGLTAAALLVSIFKRLGMNCYYYIPNRLSEGYGLSSTGIKKAASYGADLIVTVDCGVSSHDEVKLAISMGLDIIVTDHHEPPEILPEATAVIDPLRTDSKYPFRHLAGVGVAFKLCQAILQDLSPNTIDLHQVLDLVALGTIADSVPLIDENRVLVSFGLREINSERCRTGIHKLKEVSGGDRDIRADTLSYTIIPRINAAGRLDHAGEVVELFLTKKEKIALDIALKLETQNKRRQKIENDVLQSALNMIELREIKNAIILAARDWHPGVIGIVASKLVDMFYRPVFLFSMDESSAKGSARGIPGLHLYELISECSGLLLGFGGHKQAAGLRILNDNLPFFEEKIDSLVGKNISAEDMIPMIEIDAAVKLSEINFNFIHEMCLLEPHGELNKAPLFGARDIRVLNHRIVGRNHLKLLLFQENVRVDTIGFNMGDQVQNIETDSRVDIAFIPGINDWQGVKNLQLNLKAIRPSV